MKRRITRKTVLASSISWALGALLAATPVLADDVSRVVGIKASPVDKQVILSLTAGRRASMISPVEKGKRQLIIDIQGAELDMKERADMLKLIKGQLPEITDITLDEFRVNREPIVRLVVKTQDPNISGALTPGSGNVLVLQLLKQAPSETAQGVSPDKASPESTKGSVSELEQAPDRLPEAVLSAQTSKKGLKHPEKLLEKKIDEAEILRFERNVLSDQVKNLQKLITDQNRMIAHLRDQQELLMVKNSIKPEREQIEALQGELELLNQSYDELKQTLMTYQKQVVAQDDALKAAQDSFHNLEAKTLSKADSMTGSAWGRGGLLNTLADLSKEELDLLVFAEKAFREGKSLELQGNFTGAEMQYKKALQSAPQVEEYALALGTLYIAQKKLDEAAGIFKAALKYHPEDTRLLNEMGKTALLQKDSATALQYFAQAIPAGVLSNYASTLKRAQRLNDAESVYKLALTLNPVDSDLQFNLGNLYLGQKRFPEAQQHFQEAVRINPNFAEAHYHLGLAYVEQGRFDLAKTELQAYLEKLPTASNKSAVESYLKDLDQVYSQK